MRIDAEFTVGGVSGDPDEAGQGTEYMVVLWRQSVRAKNVGPGVAKDTV